MEFSPNVIIKIVIESAQRTASSMGEDVNTFEMNEQTPLMNYMGNQGLFDSFGLVAFIVEVEDTVEKQFGVRLALADERAASQEIMPFTSVSALVEYIEQLLLEI
jgi:acyl carrier protein